MSGNLLCLVIAVLCALCAARSPPVPAKPCEGGEVAYVSKGKTINCGRGTAGPSECPGYSEGTGYCDIHPSDLYAVCCKRVRCLQELNSKNETISSCEDKKENRKNKTCADITCPKGSRCVEKSKNGVAVGVRCKLVKEEKNETKCLTPFVRRGSTCYDPRCAPSVVSKLFLGRATLLCKSRGRKCVKNGDLVKCLQLTTPTSDLPTASATRQPVSYGTHPPVPVCKDECARPYSMVNGKCTSRRCVSRGHRGAACERKMRGFCMESAEGKVECKKCSGQVVNGTCIELDCVVKRIGAVLTTVCERTAGVCELVGHVVMCIRNKTVVNRRDVVPTCRPATEGDKEMDGDGKDKDMDKPTPAEDSDCKKRGNRKDNVDCKNDKDCDQEEDDDCKPPPTKRPTPADDDKKDDCDEDEDGDCKPSKTPPTKPPRGTGGSRPTPADDHDKDDDDHDDKDDHDDDKDDHDNKDDDDHDNKDDDDHDDKDDHDHDDKDDHDHDDKDDDDHDDKDDHDDDKDDDDDDKDDDDHDDKDDHDDDKDDDDKKDDCDEDGDCKPSPTRRPGGRRPGGRRPGRKHN